MRVGVIGLGTVGGGLIKLLQDGGALGDGAISVAAVSARSRNRPRDFDISGYAWFDDPVELAAAAEIDVLVELIGGSDGPAKRAIELAIDRGVSVVTANKALLAEHGLELARAAERSGASLCFEAAIAGGIPVVKALRDGLSGANRVQAVSGILNGTCNFILSDMEATGRSFEDVLAEAQRLGYAEADPSLDVGGFDAGQKIALLAAIAFGAEPDYARVEIEGVRSITLLDIRMALKLGYRIKLIAKAERVGETVRAQVHPALVALDHPLASVNGSLNAIVVDADPVGRITLVGRGAGAGPTASAVAADLLDLAHGPARSPFGRPVERLLRIPRGEPPERGRFFVRVLVKDRPGVIAAIADQLAKSNVSIESFLQDPSHGGSEVPIVLTTQRCPRKDLMQAVGAIGDEEFVEAPPQVLAIEETNPGMST